MLMLVGTMAFEAERDTEDIGWLGPRAAINMANAHVRCIARWRGTARQARQ